MWNFYQFYGIMRKIFRIINSYVFILEQKLKKKSILIAIIAFSFGLLIGALLVFIYFGKSTVETMQIMGLQYRSDWEERAIQAYQNESHEAAIWALENLIDILQKDADISLNDKDFIQKDLILTYARLAIVLQAKGNIKEYNKNILKAFDLAKESYPNEFKSEQELINFVKKLDKVSFME